MCFTNWTTLWHILSNNQLSIPLDSTLVMIDVKQSLIHVGALKLNGTHLCMFGKAEH